MERANDGLRVLPGKIISCMKPAMLLAAAPKISLNSFVVMNWRMFTAFGA